MLSAIVVWTVMGVGPQLDPIGGSQISRTDQWILPSGRHIGYAMDLYSRDLQKLIIEDEVNVYRTDPSIMKAQLASWDTVLSNLNEDPFFKKIVESQKDWSARVAFYDLVNSADYKLAYEHYFPGKLPF